MGWAYKLTHEGLFAKEYRRPLLFCSIVVIGAVLYGYDGTYFTSILAMNKFKHDYGERQSDGSYAISSSDRSVFTSIVQAGEVVGSISAGFVGDRFGRRGAIWFASMLITIGVILQLAKAGSHPLLIVGRLILGAGVGNISNAVPLYLSELPPVAIRGAVVSSWQLMLAIGQVIGAIVGQATKGISNTASYRVPIGLNLVIVGMLAGGLFAVPESPRWLISKNHTERAEKALVRVHHHNPDRDAVVAEQMALFEKSKADEKLSSGDAPSRWSDLLRGTTRRRFICAVGILIAQQISGVQFIFSYATVFFQDLNLASPFVITIAVDIVEVAGVVVSFFLVNRFGRRPLLLYTGAFMCVCLLICGGMGIPNNQTRAENPVYNQVAAAMIILYVFAFNLAWGPLAWVVATELSTGRNRQKIMSVGTACFWTVAFAVTFTLPYLFDADKANLGPKIGFIYGGAAFLTLLFVYYMIPETLGRSLEEINFMMEARIPARQWKDYDLTGVQDIAVAIAKTSGKGTSGDAQHIEEADDDDDLDAKKEPNPLHTSENSPTSEEARETFAFNARYDDDKKKVMSV